MAKNMETRRTTIYLESELARQLRLIAAENDTSVSAVVNDFLKNCLEEDAADYAVVKQRENEPAVPFEKVVKDLKKRGKL